jgi:hypothetical protein
MITSVQGAEVRLAPVDGTVESPLLEVGAADVPSQLYLVANRTHAHLRVPEVGCFAVANGTEVRVAPCAAADSAAIDGCLHGTVTALVLGQQRRFALHANVVRVNDISIAIAGNRGIGKTTTSLSLRQRGHQILGDDVAILEPADDRVRFLTTDRPLHIAAETAASLAIDVTQAFDLGPVIGKLALEHAVPLPGRLDVIVVLARGSVPPVRALELRDLRRLRLVERNAYRAAVLRAVWSRELFAWAAAIAARIPVYVLARPLDAWTVPEVVAGIERVASSPLP